MFSFSASFKKKKTDLMCGLLAISNNKSLQLHTVQTRKDVEEAGNLLYREYRKRNYCPKVTQELHYSPYMFLEDSRTFILKKAWKTTGTISIFPDSDARLPIDSVFPNEVNRLREKGLRLAEVGLLALDTTARSRKKYSLKSIKKMQPLFALIKILINYAESKEISHCIITVHPKHRELYEYLNFKVIAEVRDYELANSNPALPMIVAVKDLTAGRKALQCYFAKNVYDPSSYDRQLAKEPDAFRELFPESYHSFVCDRGGKAKKTIKEKKHLTASMQLKLERAS